MRRERLELLVQQDGPALKLLSPEVGLFSCGLPLDAMIGPGEFAGVITSLGRSFDLVVPDGVQGWIFSDWPERTREPVGYGQVLYVLAEVDTDSPVKSGATPKRETTTSELVLRAPQSGRFYHRPAPAEPPFATAGSVVADGQPIGMIEVMKTFSHVLYRASGTLPKRARLTRWIAADGADVKSGDALFELERAD